jgi:hypothetical protein
VLTKFILAVILAEALTEILKEAVVLEPLRSPFRKWSKFDQFLSCGYCMSVWVGWGVAFLFRLEVGITVEWWWLECLVAGLVVHRISNIWHEAVVRWLGKHPFQMVFFNRHLVDEPDPEPNGEGESEVNDGSRTSGGEGLQS